MAKQDERMRSEAVALQKQRKEFEKQCAEFTRERELGSDHRIERESSDQSEIVKSKPIPKDEPTA